MKVGVVGYGAYVPRRRIKLPEIAKVWGADAESYERGLELHEKSVPAHDEDTITMAVTASRHALVRAGIDAHTIGAVYVGSESHPYAVKPSGTVVAEAVGATPAVHCADLEFACKAGSEGMFLAAALVKAGEVQHALAVGADTFGDDRFLVLPHPEVAGFVEAKAHDVDAWLGSMNRLGGKLGVPRDFLEEET